MSPSRTSPSHLSMKTSLTIKPELLASSKSRCRSSPICPQRLSGPLGWLKSLVRKTSLCGCTERCAISAVVSGELANAKPSHFHWRCIQSIKLDKSLYGALRRMGELYEKRDKPKKTAEAYDAAIARGCNEIQLAYDAANLFFEVSMPERAEQCVSTFMKNSPHDVDLTLHNIHAELLVALKRWKETVNTVDADINRLCADKSVPYELILKRGQALFHLQETDAARGCFTQLLKVNTAESLGDIIWQSADICYEFKQYGGQCARMGTFLSGERRKDLLIRSL